MPAQKRRRQEWAAATGQTSLRAICSTRALHHIHEKTVGTSTVFKVNYNSDFNEFAASVAFALRTMIVYRTDGGRFARGLVRASGDLQNIHADLRDSNAP